MFDHRELQVSEFTFISCTCLIIISVLVNSAAELNEGQDHVPSKHRVLSLSNDHLRGNPLNRVVTLLIPQSYNVQSNE